MARPSDREFALHRKIKDLDQKNKLLETEILQLRKKIERLENTEPKVKQKAPTTVPVCPDCNSPLNSQVLPFGRLTLCTKMCGYREMKKNGT